MKYINKFITVNPSKKIQKLECEILGIEKYCAFMTSLEGVQYNTSALMARKIECERKIVHIRSSQRIK